MRVIRRQCAVVQTPAGDDDNKIYHSQCKWQAKFTNQREVLMSKKQTKLKHVVKIIIEMLKLVKILADLLK